MILALSKLLKEAGIVAPATLKADPPIGAVAIDSRKVAPGTLFVALRGHQEDGFLYAPQAVEAGASAVLYDGEERPLARNLPVPSLAVPNLRALAPRLLNIIHGRPAEALFKVGVTGTNGKTTITRLAAALLAAWGRKVIRLGTIDYAYGDTVLPSALTTPGPDQFFAMLEGGVAQGCTALAMEVSSHALSQERVGGLLFDRAIFTNLTQDHLDFHADFEDYFAAKARLFSADYLAANGVAILNADSSYGLRLRDALVARGHQGFLAFTREASGADICLLKAELGLAGTRLKVGYAGKTFEVGSPLVGAINLENLLAAVSLGLSLGLSGETIASALSQVTVPGRNEVLGLANGGFAVVDYAHTPDALERVLSSLRPLTPGRLICVFGCGGDRDRKKRPLMGGIAARLADRVVVTSDNPRTESAEAIVQEIMAGVTDGSKVEIILDRREAIEAALAMAGAGDCVLVAGKGHEDYQIIGKTRHPFSDQAVIRGYAGAASEGAAWK